MLELSSIALFAGVLAIAAGSPGPSIGALVARILAKGHRDVLPFLLAMWIGEGIWLSLAVWGLAAVAETFNQVFVVLKFAGAAYLLYLAWKMWTAPAASSRDDLPERGSAFGMFAAGMSVTLGNPKIMIFYMALLPAIVPLHMVTVVGWLELLAAMAAVLVAVDLVWVYLAAGARRLFADSAASRWLNRTCAALMAAMAAAVATR